MLGPGGASFLDRGKYKIFVQPQRGNVVEETALMDGPSACASHGRLTASRMFLAHNAVSFSVVANLLDAGHES